MDAEMLPGPSLPELARTALAEASAAAVTVQAATGPRLSRVPVRAGPDGSPLLLADSGSLLARRLTAFPGPVTVTVPARMPFRSLTLTGTAGPAAADQSRRIAASRVALQSVELAGPARVRLPVEDYRAAAPDPLWRVAPGVLRHLERGHMTDLVACVRAHGLHTAEWVVPRGLDRFGLELLVLTPDGAAAVRLSFPGGPVGSLAAVPASVRTVLTCRCQDGPGQARNLPAGTD